MKTKKIILTTLLLMVVLGLASCKKTNDAEDYLPSENEVYLTSNTWIDNTGYEWTFSSNGKLKVSNDNETADGTWSYTQRNNTLVRNYNFGYENISLHDHILSIDNNTMVLESIDYEGETSTFYNRNGDPTPTPGSSLALNGTRWCNQFSHWEYGNPEEGGLERIAEHVLNFTQDGNGRNIVSYYRAEGTILYYPEYEDFQVDIDENTYTFSYYFNEDTGNGTIGSPNESIMEGFSVSGDTLLFIGIHFNKTN